MGQACAGAQPTRIMVVDDHPIVRRGLAHLLALQKDLAVCWEAEDAEQALRIAESDQPDCAIVDLSLKRSNGLDLVRDLHKRYPRLPILVVSMHDEEFYAERALRAGARGYLMKQAADETIITALRRVLDGGVYVSDAVAERILRGVAATQANGRPASVKSLSDRELDVFRLIGRALKTAEIAQELGLSAKTIETYRERIKGKLQLKGTRELTRFAVQWLLNEKGP